MTDLAPLAAPRDLVASWLSGKSSHTKRAYTSDLEAFRAWLGAETVADAARALLSGGSADANRLAFAWRGAMLDEGTLAPKTVNRRLSSLRSLAKLARMTGAGTAFVEVENVPSRVLRDTRGPSPEAIRTALASASTKERAIVALLSVLGLRVGEVVKLTMEDVEPGVRRLTVRRKGHHAKEPDKLDIPKAVTACLVAWLDERGPEPGSLFGYKTTSGVNKLTHRIAGVNPHAFRHSCGTIASALTNGNIVAVQALLGHKNMNTTAVYLDARRDLAGTTASAVVGVLLG